MTQATSEQFEDLGAIKENVRHNEKAIDEIKIELKDIRHDLKALGEKVDGLSRRFDSLGWKALLGIFVIVAANVILKFLP